tara:strand:- start:2456 stop:2896 length:441 start_codon:yes stop_codon:yes gene_type:complete
MKYLFEEVDGGMLPVRVTALSVGYDCYSNVDKIIAPGDTALIPLGFRIKGFVSDSIMDKDAPLPYLELHLRSSLRVAGLSSGGVGIIDMDYRNEIKLVITNHDVEEYRLNTGDRIAQLVAASSPIHQMSNLITIREARNGGFGSTN